jgi:hypothetical protein
MVEHAAVMEKFARVCNDPRSKDVVVSATEAVNERLFGAWSMSYAGNTDFIHARCKEYGHTGGFDPASMSGSELIAFILALVTKEERIGSSLNAAATPAGGRDCWMASRFSSESSVERPFASSNEARRWSPI